MSPRRIFLFPMEKIYIYIYNVCKGYTFRTYGMTLHLRDSGDERYFPINTALKLNISRFANFY